MNVILVRVGADTTPAGGGWNGPVDLATREFVYAPIRESDGKSRPGFERRFAEIEPALGRFGRSLPSTLSGKAMHLDPDFEHFTYGDQGQRAKQLADHATPGSWLVFFAGLRDVATNNLAYALIGRLVVDRIVPARDVPPDAWGRNAHTRRTDPRDDIVVIGRAGESGRLQRCLPIGEYRDRAWRIRRDLLDAWGGVDVNDGYIQRSARLPRLQQPQAFVVWWNQQSSELIARNNP